MMYLTLLRMVSSTVPSSRTKSVVTPPKAAPVRAIWFKKRWADPRSKLIKRLDMESMRRLPPFFDCMFWSISLLASAMIPASWLSSRVPETENFSLSFGVSEDQEYASIKRRELSFS